ncbi:hypothetical protein [Rhodanobacter sp. DHB23]|uniref:hypothetical protein n=1 Tax=Rhodanobacter sp. DHB23 TaxID=2775923 RepID=UPI0017817164|nr:hypothetical protein [Rhodanobacter sp. DHB23]MBD8871925.1 hypothetical protein [Rhodanobacter sp. DHB23]
MLPKTIPIKRYPELRLAARHLPETARVTPAEALGLYERDARRLDRQHMNDAERTLLNTLIREVGHGVFNG